MARLSSVCYTLQAKEKSKNLSDPCQSELRENSFFPDLKSGNQPNSGCVSKTHQPGICKSLIPLAKSTLKLWQTSSASEKDRKGGLEAQCKKKF